MSRDDTPRLEVHTHSYVSGPNSRGGYDQSGKWREKDVTHAHEGGSIPHTHPDTGPSRFIGRGSKRGPKFVAKPNGVQLAYIERTPEQNTFRVIFVDEYTPGHASAGISRERWEHERAAFIAIAAGSDAYESISADQRIINDFGMTPIYILDKPGA